MEWVWTSLHDRLINIEDCCSTGTTSTGSGPYDPKMGPTSTGSGPHGKMGSPELEEIWSKMQYIDSRYLFITLLTIILASCTFFICLFKRRLGLFTQQFS